MVQKINLTYDYVDYSPYLAQSLINFPELETIQYNAICHFFNNPCFQTLIKAVECIDREISWSQDLDQTQIDCIQYLIRDWGYEHIKEQLTVRQKKQLFIINGKKQSSGHFLTAIDFAKRNPKDNYLIMRFGLTLLIHSALKPIETKPKIEALEQLLSSVYRNEPKDSGQYTKNISHLVALNIAFILAVTLNYYYL
jgi:hypothetical protein